jgi:hypothetical protein
MLLYALIALAFLGGPVLAWVRTVYTRLSSTNDRAPFRPEQTGNFPVAANETAADMLCCALYPRIQTLPSTDLRLHGGDLVSRGGRRADDTKERVGRTIDSFWVGNLPDVVKAPDPNLGSVNEATRISLPCWRCGSGLASLSAGAADPEVADRRFSRPTLICSCQRSAGEAETGDAAWARIMSNLMLGQSPTS